MQNYIERIIYIMKTVNDSIIHRISLSARAMSCNVGIDDLGRYYLVVYYANIKDHAHVIHSICMPHAYCYHVDRW
jgi:hypothetical protein